MLIGSSHAIFGPIFPGLLFPVSLMRHTCHRAGGLVPDSLLGRQRHANRACWVTR